MGVLICAATATEARACRRGVADAGLREQIEVLETGVGPERAGRRLAERLGAGPLPSLIVSSGFAGALDEAIGSETWVTATEVHGSSAVPYRAARVCRWVTQDALQRKVSSPGAAVDMESAAWARVAASHGVPFMVLRLVTDTPASPLPGFVVPMAEAMAATSTWVRARSGARCAARAMSDPRGILRLVRRGVLWTGLLRRGWANHAPVVVDGITLKT